MKSVFREWPRIRRQLTAYPTVWLFFDFDGTLAPIADKPHLAQLPPKTLELLRTLAAQPHFKIGFVSGRQIQDLRDKIKLTGCTWIGNHGAEIFHNKCEFVEPQAMRLRPYFKQLARTLKSRVREIPGCIIEDKKLSVSVHFRLISRHAASRLYKIVTDAMDQWTPASAAVLRLGKKVFEIRPKSLWNKGAGIRWVLRRSRVPAAIFFIGDDATDEDAFRELRQTAVTVRVGKLKGSAATYYVKRQSQVDPLLKKFIRLCHDP